MCTCCTQTDNHFTTNRNALIVLRVLIANNIAAKLTDDQLTNQVNNQSLVPSTEMKQLTFTLKVTNAQVVETLVTVKKNSRIQDYVHPDDQT